MASRIGEWKRAVLEKHFSGESMNYRQMTSLYIPVLIDQAFLVLFNLLNTAMISSAGVAAVSAVSTVDSLNILLFFVFAALSAGGTVVVAQYKGSGNESMVSKAAAGSVTSAFLFAFCVSLLVTAFQKPILLGFLGSAEPDVIAHSQTYLIGSSLSYMGIAVVQAVSGALGGVGRTRSSLILSLIMNFLYLLLNIVLIGWLDMGVLGMSIAANAARYAAAICALFYLVKLSGGLNIRIQDFSAWNSKRIKSGFFRHSFPIDRVSPP